MQVMTQKASTYAEWFHSPNTQKPLASCYRNQRELMLFWCFLKCSRRTLRGFQDIRRGAQPRSSPLLSMTFLYHQKLSLR